MANQLCFSRLVSRLLPTIGRQWGRSVSSAAAPLPERRSSETELRNGVRVVSEELSSSATACVGLWMDCGSRDETERTSGATNLAVNALLSAQVEQRLRPLGASLRATVLRDRTSLVVRCLSSDVKAVVGILGALVTGPALDESAVGVARARVLRRMRELDADWPSVVMNGLHAMAFQNTSLALNPIGRTESVERLTAKELSDHLETHVRGPRLVLSAAGALDHNDLARAVEEHFGGVSMVYDKSEIPLKTSCRYTGSDIRVRDDAMPVAHVAIAVEGAPLNSPDRLPLQLTSHLLGAWDRTFGGGTDVSSYLGLCSATDNLTHAFRAFDVSYAETGLLGAYLVCERMKQEDAIWHLTYEWKRFANELTDNELNRAKNSLVAQLMRAHDTPEPLVHQMASQVLDVGRRVPLEETRAQILSISAQRVRNVCNEYVWDRCPVVSAIGPIEQLEDYEVLRSKFYWFRY